MKDFAVVFCKKKIKIKKNIYKRKKKMLDSTKTKISKGSKASI